MKQKRLVNSVYKYNKTSPLILIALNRLKIEKSNRMITGAATFAFVKVVMGL